MVMKRQTQQTNKQDAPTGLGSQAPASSKFSNQPTGSTHLEAPTLPDPTKSVGDQLPATLFAMCLFGEARGESDLALQSVAQVILNRANNPRPLFGSRKGASFDENLRCVILQPQQFSSLNPYDINYPGLMFPLDHEQPQVWDRCLRCAEQAIANKDRSDTLTANSDHYFDDSISPPSWAHPSNQTVRVGPLTFYRIYLTPPTGGAALQSQAPASALSSGSRLRAKVSAARQQLPANAGDRDTLARGLHGPRHHTSLAAPTFPNDRPGGPGSYPRYNWSGRLSIFALLCLTLVMAACSDFERTTYQVLALTKAEFETTQDHIADAAAHGLITESQWAQFATQGNRFIAAHNAAVDAFQLWSQTKSASDSARVQALLQVLPQLIQEINTLVQSFQQPPPAPTSFSTDDPAPLATVSLRSNRRVNNQPKTEPRAEASGQRSAPGGSDSRPVPQEAGRTHAINQCHDYYQESRGPPTCPKGKTVNSRRFQPTVKNF